MLAKFSLPAGDDHILGEVVILLKINHPLPLLRAKVNLQELKLIHMQFKS